MKTPTEEITTIEISDEFYSIMATWRTNVGLRVSNKVKANKGDTIRLESPKKSIYVCVDDVLIENTHKTLKISTFLEMF